MKKWTLGTTSSRIGTWLVPHFLLTYQRSFLSILLSFCTGSTESSTEDYDSGRISEVMWWYQRNIGPCVRPRTNVRKSYEGTHEWHFYFKLYSKLIIIPKWWSPPEWKNYSVRKHHDEKWPVLRESQFKGYTVSRAETWRAYQNHTKRLVRRF